MNERSGMAWRIGVLTCLLLLRAAAATAGCGCDHPPPSFALVMPPFGSPGKTLQVHADGFELAAGVSWEVEFGEVTAIATDVGGVLEVEVPEGVEPGPVALRIRGGDVDVSYEPDRFTALAPAPVVPAGTGVHKIERFPVSVTADGTLLIPLNLEQVLDPTQFAFQFGLLRAAFGPDDVVFYNEDGVDLTLFTLAVDDSTQRQWGSYYGWEVESDADLRGEVFESKVRPSLWTWLKSDLLTYWRHEFHTYAQAHAPGGSHQTDAEGWHVGTGTRHVDHDHLILAISAKERSFWRPFDETRHRAFDPGRRTVDLFVATEVSENPIEPDVMEQRLDEALLSSMTSMLLESSSSYRD